MLAHLPTVVVDEFLDWLPSWRAESNGWIPKKDETGCLNVLRDSENLLDLRLSTCRSRPVNGQAGGKTLRMGCEHKVLDCRIDARIPYLFTLANTVQVNAAIDYDWYFLGVPKHLCSLIVHVSHPSGHSRAT